MLSRIQKVVINTTRDWMNDLITSDDKLTRKHLRTKHILKLIRLDRLKIFRIMDTALKGIFIKKSEMVAPLGFVYETTKRIRNKHLYDNTLWMKFECIKIPVPGGYHDFLCNRYGEYMKPSQVSTTHGDVFFDPEKSYTSYWKDIKKGINPIIISESKKEGM